MLVIKTKVSSLIREEFDKYLLSVPNAAKLWKDFAEEVKSGNGVPARARTLPELRILPHSVSHFESDR